MSSHKKQLINLSPFQPDSCGSLYYVYYELASVQFSLRLSTGTEYTTELLYCKAFLSQLCNGKALNSEQNKEVSLFL
jgi:hypothetical protein